MKSWEYEKWITDKAYKDGFSEGRNDGFNDGFNDGIEQTNQLNLRLAESGRTKDIIKAAQNPAYRIKLLEEFDIK